MMAVFGTVVAMLGLIALVMLAGGLYFMRALHFELQGVALHLGEVARCLREELDELKAQKQPPIMMLPRGLLSEAAPKADVDPKTGRYL